MLFSRRVFNLTTESDFSRPEPEQNLDCAPAKVIRTSPVPDELLFWRNRSTSVDRFSSGRGFESCAEVAECKAADGRVVQRRHSLKDNNSLKTKVVNLENPDFHLN